VRLLDDHRIDVHDVVVRRPTLDDVFLQLTGHTAEAPSDTDDDVPDDGARAERPAPATTGGAA